MQSLNEGLSNWPEALQRNERVALRDYVIAQLQEWIPSSLRRNEVVA